VKEACRAARRRTQAGIPSEAVATVTVPAPSLASYNPAPGPTDVMKSVFPGSMY
jgi:hypothetical protein